MSDPVCVMPGCGEKLVADKKWVRMGDQPARIGGPPSHHQVDDGWHCPSCGLIYKHPPARPDRGQW